MDKIIGPDSILMGKYKLTDSLIGRGGFSQVYMGEILETGEKIAIKKIKKTTNRKITDKIISEISIVMKLNHPNIIKFYDVLKTEEYVYIFMEYSNMGTLVNVIEYHKKMANNLGFDIESNSRYYLKQLKSALEYLHSINAVHRDIKPANILIHNITDIKYTNYDHKNNFVLKLADFGMAKSNITHDISMMDTICGSPMYMAPELTKNIKYTSNVDLWSYGIIMYQLIYGRNPYNINIYGITPSNIIFDNEFLYTKKCMKLLKNLLSEDPTNRISWNDFINDQWFIDIKNHKHSTPITIQINKSKDSSDIVSTIESPSSPTSPLGLCNLSRMSFDDRCINNFSNKYFTSSWQNQNISSCPSNISKKIGFNTIEQKTSDIEEPIDDFVCL